MDAYVLQGGRLTFAGSSFHSAKVVRTAPISGKIKVTGMCGDDDCPAPKVQTFYITLRDGEILDIDSAELRKSLPKVTDAFGVCRKCKKETWLRTWWWADDTCSTRCSDCGELQ